MKQAIIAAITISLIGGCTNLSDKKQEILGVISTRDINEANYVKKILNSQDGAKGNFRVEPGSTVTTVHIKSPDEPLDEEACRKWMRSIKASLSEHRGREANTLRFVFKNVTIEE